MLLVTICGCSNNDEELRKVSNNSTNVSVKVKVPPLNRNLNSDTSTTANKSEVKENTTEFSTISKENVEKETEKSTTKSNNFKSKNKNNLHFSVWLTYSFYIYDIIKSSSEFNLRCRIN